MEYSQLSQEELDGAHALALAPRRLMSSFTPKPTIVILTITQTAQSYTPTGALNVAFAQTGLVVV